MKASIRVLSRIIFLTFLFSLILCPKAFSQNQAEIDSLKQEIARAQQDSSHIRLLWLLGNKYRGTMPDTALSYYQQALDISTKLDRKEDMVSTYQRIGSMMIRKGSYDLAVEQYLTSIEICEEIGNKKGIAKAHNDMGIAYKNQGAYDKAIEHYLISLRLKEELEDRRGISSSYNNIAVIYAMQEIPDKAIEYFQMSLDIKEELGDKRGMASSYNNIAIIHARQDAFDEAIDYFQKALEINKETDNKMGASLCYVNIGNVQKDQGAYDEAIESYMESLVLKEELGDKRGMAMLYHNIADLNIDLADSIAVSERQRLDYLNKAIANGKLSLELALEIKALPQESKAAFNLQRAFAMLGKYEEAYEYVAIYIAARDSLENEERTRAIQDMATKYETEKKEQQIALQETELIAKDAVIKQQKTFRNALAAGLLAVVIIIVVIVYAYRQKKKDNKKIRDQNEQILESNEELKVLNEAISKQNNEILDSITYAQRIQAAMLPPVSLFNELLDEVFILYKPRDIVSGDFFWIKQVNQYTIVAAADCTGHGVPGAFMSLLGISYLNEIVQRREITQANQVLNELRSQIKRSLRQHGLPDESKDGIDMALCAIDRKKRIMQFAGANNPIYLIKEKNEVPELIEIKADKMPLGYYGGKDKSFTNHEIKLELGDTFYLFSDGFIDQKGGRDNRKFMSKNLKKLLMDIHDQPMFDQKLHLEKTLEGWMSGQSQMDDILIIGVRV
jgi:serine phosphatase RsbU (regulator of sigma subunit)